MRALLLLAALLLAGCSGTGSPIPGTGFVGYYHDAPHRVSCWTVYDKSISCLPDSQVWQP